MEQKVSYLNSRGRTINGILTLPDDNSRSGKVPKSGEGALRFPCVALCTHFTGFKELKHLYAMSKDLASKGIASLRFDYADCFNVKEHGEICNDVTLTGYVIDLISTLDFLDRQPEINSTRLGAAGHSIGGSTSILGASKDSRIKAIVSIAPLAKGEWEPLFKKRRKEWEKTGYLTFKTPKKGEVKIGFVYFQDLLEYDGTEAAKKIEAPLCIIHGTKDELLPVKHSEALYKSAKSKPKKLEKIQGADHLFTKPEHEKKMIELCTNWFEKYL